MVDDNSTEHNRSVPTNNEPEAKRRKKDKEKDPRHKCYSPTQAPKGFKEASTNQTDTTEYRRSPRVSRVTAKYLESIQAELKDSDDE